MEKYFIKIENEKMKIQKKKQKKYYETRNFVMLTKIINFILQIYLKKTNRTKSN